MRVNYLFIIGVVPSVPNGISEKSLKEDTLSCMNALLERHRKKCASVVCMAFEYANNFQSFLAADIDDRNFMTAFDEASGAFRSINECNRGGLVKYGVHADELDSVSPDECVGVFLIGNYDRDEGVLESMAVAPIAAMLASLNLPRIDKLCLVACSAGRVGKTTKDNKLTPVLLNADTQKAQNANEKCFIYALCQKLNGLGLQPLIAGWDGYVEVTTPENSGAQAALGKLITKDGDKVSQKRVIQFTGGKPTWHLNTAGWSNTKMLEKI